MQHWIARILSPVMNKRQDRDGYLPHAESENSNLASHAAGHAPKQVNLEYFPRVLFPVIEYRGEGLYHSLGPSTLIEAWLGGTSNGRPSWYESIMPLPRNV